MIWIIRAMQVLSYLSALCFTLFIFVAVYGRFIGELPTWISITSSNYGGVLPFWPFIWLIIRLALFAYAFYCLARLFGLFVKRRYFSKKGVYYMRVFAATYVGTPIISFIIHTSYELHQRGHLHIPNNVIGENIVPIMLGMTFLIIAHVLNEARINNEELDSYF